MKVLWFKFHWKTWKQKIPVSNWHELLPSTHPTLKSLSGFALKDQQSSHIIAWFLASISSLVMYSPSCVWPSTRCVWSLTHGGIWWHTLSLLFPNPQEMSMQMWEPHSCPRPLCPLSVGFPADGTAGASETPRAHRSLCILHSLPYPLHSHHFLGLLSI